VVQLLRRLGNTALVLRAEIRRPFLVLAVLQTVKSAITAVSDFEV